MKEFPSDKPQGLARAEAWGWTDDSCLQYLHPEGYLSANGVDLRFYKPCPRRMRGKTVTERKESRNQPTTKGTWEGWLEAANIAADYPHAYSALYVSLTSLLLPVLDLDNFGMEFCAPTSTGKTTALNFGVSAWGEFRELSSCWGSAGNALRAEAYQGCVPRTRDEVQLAAKVPLGTWVYAVSGGRAYTSRWRSVFLSAGETSAGKRTGLEGIHARVISLHGPPFGHDPSAGGQAAEEVVAICRQHHGHMSLRMASYMVEHHERLYPALRASHHGRFEALVSRESAGAFRRHARYLAAIQVAADLAHSLGLPAPRSSLSPGDLLYRSAMDSSGAADTRRRSFVQLCLFLRSRRDCFLTATARGITSSKDFRELYPSSEFAGIWNHDSAKWKSISVARAFLVANKGKMLTWIPRHFDEWLSRGYVAHGAGGHVRSIESLGKENTRKNTRTIAVARGPFGEGSRTVSLSGFRIPREQYELAIAEAPTSHPVLSAQYPG